MYENWRFNHETVKANKTHDSLSQETFEQPSIVVRILELYTHKIAQSLLKIKSEETLQLLDKLKNNVFGTLREL